MSRRSGEMQSHFLEQKDRKQHSPANSLFQSISVFTRMFFSLE